MKIQCLHCKTVYNIDEAKIPAGGARIKCKKCEQKIHIPPAQPAAPKPPQAQAFPQHPPEIDAARGQMAGNNEAAAVKILYEGIIRYVDENQFHQAEQLRDELMDSAPMAITEIVGSAEIIESRKKAVMDPSRLSRWNDLFAALSDSESAAFYFALTDTDVHAGDRIFEQGQMDQRLYLIQSGKFQLSYYDHQNEQRNDYAVLEAGDIAGADSFFQYTNHTVSLAALENGQVSYLDKPSLERILTDNPALESKLSAYCLKKANRIQMSSANGAGRRAYRRYECNLKGSFQVMDGKGDKSVKATPMLITDISQGGICCMVQNLKKQQADLLLGSSIHVHAAISGGKTNREFNQAAKVVSVRILPFEECTVHAHFTKTLDEDLVLEMSGHQRN